MRSSFVIVLALVVTGVAAAAPEDPLVQPRRYAHSLAALGFPGAKRAFQVGAGNQVYSGDLALIWTFDSDEPVETSPVYFESDGVPVAHWSASSASFEARFEAAAVPIAALGDTSLVLSVRLSVTSRRQTAEEFAFEVRATSTPSGPHFVPWDARPSPAITWEPNDHTVRIDGEATACMDPTATTEAQPLTLAYGQRLSPGEVAQWHFSMTAYPTRLSDAELRSTPHEQVVARARQAWRQLLAEGAAFHTPNDLTNVALRAALVTLIQSQEQFGADWAPMGNPFQYRDIWLRDGARVVRALAVLGHTERARANARFFRHFQLPHGAFMSQRGQLDGTGQALWAFAEAASLPPSPAFATPLVPLAGQALRWLEGQRIATRDAGAPWPGLLPYAHPRDAELVRGQLVGNDAWAIAGYEAAMRLAELAGRDDLASAAARALASYKTTFSEALDRTGHSDVPPSWGGPGLDWGNLSAGYPTRALPPDDPRLAHMAQRVWSQRGRQGLLYYAHPDSLHTYLGADLAQWALMNGDAGPALEYVDEFLHSSSSTLGQAEIFERNTGGFGRNMPPHTTAAATFVDLVRNMILFEDGPSLVLGAGAPIVWWEGTRVERAPTYFGVIDVELRRDGNHLHAEWSAVDGPVRIRVPDGYAAVGVSVTGQLTGGGRWVECAPGVTRVECTVEERRSR